MHPQPAWMDVERTNEGNNNGDQLALRLNATAMMIIWSSSSSLFKLRAGEQTTLRCFNAVFFFHLSVSKRRASEEEKNGNTSSCDAADAAADADDVQVFVRARQREKEL